MPFYVALAVVILITVLPLFVVLPTAPPMFDDNPRPVHAQLFRGIAGWRITVTVARQEAQHP